MKSYFLDEVAKYKPAIHLLLPAGWKIRNTCVNLREHLGLKISVTKDNCTRNV